MNILKKFHFLPFTALVLGAAAFGLRTGLYSFAVDQRGLLVSGHPLSYALWAVVMFGAAFLLWNVRKLDGSNVYEDNFSSSTPAAFSCGLMALGLLMTVKLQSPVGTGAAVLLWRILGILCIPAMVWAGVSRGQGKKPFFGTHAVLCLFLLIHMIGRYQLWSANPQLQDYVFELLAAISLTLFSYYCAAFEADMGSRRMQLATGLLAVLLCPVALAGSEPGWLYVYGTVWVLFNLCTLTPPPKEEVKPDDAA